MATDIEFLIDGNIAVRGFSGSGIATWDFTKITFSGDNGAILSENREEIPNISLEDAFVIEKDNSNNIYLAGSTIDQSISGKDIQLVKINANFNIEWIRTIDIDGLNDVSRSLTIDNQENIIIAGNSERVSNGTQMTIAKFTPDGTQVFKKDYLAESAGEKAEVAKVKTTSEGDIILVGSTDRIGSKDIVTIIYDENGNRQAEKIFEGDNGANDVARNLDITAAGDIIVTGTSKGDETKYNTVKYAPLKRSNEVVLEDGEIHHRGQEFIIKFLPEYVNTDFVNDTRKQYGTIDEVLLVNAATEISGRIQLRSVLFSKVFPRLSTTHTQSITRLGETISIPKFWSVFLVVLEENQSLEQLMSDLAGMTEFVAYAHYNHLYQHHTLPDDEFFVSDNQSSLFPSNEYPDAHINVEPAWDIETGQSYTKVGIYDDIIFWGHEDFGDGTLAGSQVVGGWDFKGNANISSVTDPVDSHGTSVAGIVGALRDNALGVSGIAGGGLDARGNFNPGVQLFSLGIFGEPDFEGDTDSAGDDAIAAAIVEGAMYDPTQNPTGYGLHIQNHSWGGPGSNTVRDAVKFAWSNQCILVTSRGNFGNDDPLYPTSYSDDWVLSIGGSGADGEYYNGNNGNGFDGGTGSSFGGTMDIIAPATYENILSTINPNVQYDSSIPGPIGSSANYQGFNGTSASAPHVAGVAALI